ncbi:conjugative transfer signal peptidase TraF [Pseudoduganella violacea]|uniref:Conjugal transfer pilin signal peptidase TrbI n=1 Tax=Pseudoduganella violacea TaxID=1715466 RepID=A0A7W5BFZ0_9BURK|nr:conjugative transfer signal peptidase TraF [Pseudoduganella violacea]MBB3122171.1 conjugal transfer pilin signal peptidase TrbI [Pseudoduganella violacea]
MMDEHFLHHARRRWYLYLPLGAIWSLAAVRVLVDPAPRLPLLFNVTPSLPYTVAIVQYGAGPVRRGDYVIYACRGPAARLFPGLAGQPFFKRVGGVPGDQVQVVGRRVFVNGADAGQAKRYTAASRLPLEPIADAVIPPRYFYMQGTSPDSFDSRYRITGLVRADDIIAVVRPLF